MAPYVTQLNSKCTNKRTYVYKRTINRHAGQHIVTNNSNSSSPPNHNQIPGTKIAVKLSATTSLQTLPKVGLVKCLWTIKPRLHCVSMSRTPDNFIDHSDDSTRQNLQPPVKCQPFIVFKNRCWAQVPYWDAY